MKLKIHIIHSNKDLSFSINAPIKLAVEATTKYLSNISKHKFTKPEQNLIKSILINNGSVKNDINTLIVEANASKRTIYRARKKLIQLNIIETKNNYLIPNTNTFNSFVTYIV